MAFHAQTEHGGAWTTYDWSQITTVIAFGPLPSDLMCHAHSVGARYVFATDVTLTMPDASYIGQASYETAYINAVVDLMVLKRADGINFDQEGYRGPAAALTSLLQRLAAAVRAVNPNAQVSMDLSFNSPQPAYQSWYDVPALANQVDFLVSMVRRHANCWAPQSSSAVSKVRCVAASAHHRLGLVFSLCTSSASTRSLSSASAPSLS